jgi:nucleoside 2-deoxyribosyltransferase
MAMGYGATDAAEAFRRFKEAVSLTGFELKRSDEAPKAGLIDLRMRVEIRTAKFVIADLTDDNRGAYWEGGFAEGVGKKVYYTCEADKFEKLKTHFDTEHLLTIKWKLANMEMAIDELKAVIRNDFYIDAILEDQPNR